MATRERYKKFGSTRLRTLFTLASKVAVKAIQLAGTSTWLELFGLKYEASPVNYLQVTASATGNPVVLEAVGDDTNIDIQLKPKGTGAVKANMTTLDQITAAQLRNDDGTVVDATGGAGLFSLTSAGMGTGTLTLDGEAASGNIKTDTVMFEYVLPSTYVASDTINVIVEAIESVGEATDSTTFSIEAYEDDGEGGVSADLAGTPDETDITATTGTLTTAITDAGLSAGDKLRIFLKVITNDTAGSVGTIAQITKIAVQTGA